MTNAEVIAALDSLMEQIKMLRDELAKTSVPVGTPPSPFSGGGPGEE